LILAALLTSFALAKAGLDQTYIFCLFIAKNDRTSSNYRASKPRE